MSGLPQYFEPVRLAERGEAIAGELAVSQMPRLRQSLLDDSGTVRFRIACETGEQGVIRIHGDLSTTLNVQCQRCLGAFDLPLNVRIEARALAENIVAGNPDCDADVLMHGDDNLVHLTSFVEDELILSIPLAPLHSAGKCPVAEYRNVTSRPPDGPFAALKTLIAKPD